MFVICPTRIVDKNKTTFNSTTHIKKINCPVGSEAWSQTNPNQSVFDIECAVKISISYVRFILASKLRLIGRNWAVRMNEWNDCLMQIYMCHAILWIYIIYESFFFSQKKSVRWHNRSINLSNATSNESNEKIDMNDNDGNDGLKLNRKQIFVTNQNGWTL